MAKTVVRQVSFAGGELSPYIFGHADKEMYFSGGKRVRNVYIRPQGPIRQRYGSKYIGATTTNQAARLVGFQFNVEQAYLLVFTPAEMKVYRNDALVATVTTGLSGLTATIINEMDYTQSADTLILVHPDIQPISITRTSHTSWTAANITLSNIPTYDFGSGAEAVWSGSRGWPRSVTFWQQRLWFGGSKSRPQTVWGSKLADFYNFDLGTGLDDEAISITIDDDEVNAINNIFAGRTLQVFTVGGEYFVPVNVDRTVTPGTISIEKATRHGSKRIRPVSNDGATMFVDLNGAVVREYLYLDIEQSYVADDISYRSSHLIVNPVRMALQRATAELPAAYVYVVNSDGTIALLQRQRNQKFLAWALWETEGEYEDVAVTGNDVYVTVKRTINSGTVRYIEKFDKAYYTDAGIKLNSAATTSWSGLSHLEGEEVYVRSGDGYPLLNNTVDTGAITTEKAQTDIEVGLPWVPILETMPSESDRGIISGKRRRIPTINIQFNESNSVTVNGYRVSLAQFGDVVLDNPLAAFTGWKRVSLLGFSRNPTVTITNSGPVDFGVVSLVMEVTV